MRGRRIGWVVVALVAAVCAGCHGGSGQSSYQNQSTKVLAGELAQAKAADADQSQLDVLSGTAVTFDQYKGTIDQALDCMRDAGLQIVKDDTEHINGHDQIEYWVASGSVPDAKATDVQDACYTKYAKFVDEFWQASTPEQRAYDDRRRAALHDPLMNCLKG